MLSNFYSGKCISSRSRGLSGQKCSYRLNHNPGLVLGGGGGGGGTILHKQGNVSTSWITCSKQFPIDGPIAKSWLTP